jgi:hypothetical protein
MPPPTTSPPRPPRLPARQNPNLARPMPEPRQSVEDIQRLAQQARAPGVREAGPDMDPEVELEGMDAEDEMLAAGGSMIGTFAV